MKYHLVTLGCPKNVTDSERLTRALTQAGHVGIDDSDLADLLIVNSCGFIDAAKDESAQTTASLGAAKREDQRLIVVGCWSQIEPEPAAAIPGVERTFGIEAWDDIIGWLGPSDPVDIPETGALTRTSAYLKIADGCSRPCTFCNIPAIKGREFRSATVESLLDEARRLADEGVKELILVAQDSTAYAEDLGQADGLAYLLEQLAREVPQVPWLRLMYAYPGFVSDRLVEAMAGIPQVCHYLDIPLQHGSPSVLKRMKRPHNLRMVHHTLDRLRTAMPDIAIRTTFLVGFPGETKAEFEELLDFVRESRFDRAGAFAFSPQQGTPAAALPGQLEDRIKQRRQRRLMSVQEGIAAEINDAYLGRELTILVESIAGQTDDEGRPLFVGRSYRDAPEIDGLVFCYGVARPGSMPRVRVTGNLGHDLLAEPVGAEVIPVLNG
ncbi:MAG: 30S ribosomal protein S12 methylthiotransferase RimO [Chloroflexi bacterium]|nr:30S ribosomal protein S12 methylthiotransferase RimO [Chloroflexota bacterium]